MGELLGIAVFGGAWILYFLWDARRQINLGNLSDAHGSINGAGFGVISVILGILFFAKHYS